MPYDNQKGQTNDYAPGGAFWPGGVVQPILQSNIDADIASIIQNRAAAEAAALAAEASASEAAVSAQEAEDSALVATTAASGAQASEIAAEAAALAASTSETNAANSAVNALASETAAGVSAGNAATSETNAANSAVAALASQNAAAVSAQEAEDAAASIPPDVLVPADIGVTVEAFDATILKEADIGITVQGYDVDTAKTDALANFTAGLQDNGLALVRKTSDTGAALIPAGTTAERPAPASEVYGEQRANSTLNIMEWWNGTAWVPMGGGATGGAGNPVFHENDTNVTVDYTITSGKNAVSAGPITIDTGITVTVPTGSVWSIV